MDMIDVPTSFSIQANQEPTQFADIFPPKWKSSLTVFYYIADPTDTSQDYPDGRIVYLRISGSITGYNPSEDLTPPPTGANQDNPISSADAVNQTVWETISGSDWASKYTLVSGQSLD